MNVMFTGGILLDTDGNRMSAEEINHFYFLEFENGRIFADYLDGYNLSILHER